MTESDYREQQEWKGSMDIAAYVCNVITHHLSDNKEQIPNHSVPDLRAKMRELYSDPVRMLKALYDLSEVYDLWYGRGDAE